MLNHAQSTAHSDNAANDAGSVDSGKTKKQTKLVTSKTKDTDPSLAAYIEWKNTCDDLDKLEADGDNDDELDAAYERCAKLEKLYLDIAPTTAKGLLTLAQHLLKASEGVLLDEEAIQRRTKQIEKITGKLVKAAQPVSDGTATLKEAAKVLKELKTPRELRALNRSHKAFNGNLMGKPIKYIGEPWLATDKPKKRTPHIMPLILPSGHRPPALRAQQIEWGDTGLKGVEKGNEHYRGFEFDDAEVRACYEKHNITPVCDFRYVPEYPPHPGEKSHVYEARMDEKTDSWNAYAKIRNARPPILAERAIRLVLLHEVLDKEMRTTRYNKPGSDVAAAQRLDAALEEYLISNN